MCVYTRRYMTAISNFSPRLSSFYVAELGYSTSPLPPKLVRRCSPPRDVLWQQLSLGILSPAHHKGLVYGQRTLPHSMPVLTPYTVFHVGFCCL